MSKISYQEFLKTKGHKHKVNGIEYSNPTTILFPFQQDIVKRACHVGKYAIFADCGLGKSGQQLEWADNILSKTGGKQALVVAPLAVAEQTKAEGDKFGIPVTVCRSQADVKKGINITNYEMLHHFNPKEFSAIVLDESGILKNHAAKTRHQVTEFGTHIPYRLCCTATPAPNDIMEIGTHSAFLGNMSRAEMLATFFVHDGGETQKWRLKGHAVQPFYKWLASWSIAVRKPSDLGYENGDFILPPLNFHQHIVKSEADTGSLFAMEATDLNSRRRARKTSLTKRVELIADLVNGSNEPWILWCDLNAEADALKRIISGAVEVRGTDTVENKKNNLLGFSRGDIKKLITKPTIAGHGLNWQHCSNVVFTGISDSFEQTYQAVRRCWRFGQTKPVNVHIVISEKEGSVLKNIQRKEKQANEFYDNLIKNMNMEITS